MKFDSFKLYLYRIEQGINQSQFAQKLDVTREHLSNIEAGKTKNPGVLFVARAAKCMEVKMEDFIVVEQFD